MILNFLGAKLSLQMKGGLSEATKQIILSKLSQPNCNYLTPNTEFLSPEGAQSKLKKLLGGK